MIISISYLVSADERDHVKAKNGKFILVKKRSNRYSTPKSSIVEYINRRDPYITLENGTKMRVYRGGNPQDEVIETICIIESYDEKMRKKTGNVLIPPHDYQDYLEW